MPDSPIYYCALPLMQPLQEKICRWSLPEVAWTITGRLPGISDEEQLAAAAEAWGYWQAACGVQPYHVADPAVANVLMGTGRIDGSLGTLAWSEMPCGGQRQLRQKYDFERFVIAEDPPQGFLDIVRIMAHEIGHVLGVPHDESGAASLLAPTYNPRVRRPQAWDIRQAQLRYGKPVVSVPVPGPVPPSPPVPVPVPTPTPQPGGVMPDALKSLILLLLPYLFEFLKGWIEKNPKEVAEMVGSLAQAMKAQQKAA